MIAASHRGWRGTRWVTPGEASPHEAGVIDSASDRYPGTWAARAAESPVAPAARTARQEGDKQTRGQYAGSPRKSEEKSPFLLPNRKRQKERVGALYPMALTARSARLARSSTAAQNALSPAVGISALPMPDVIEKSP